MKFGKFGGNLPKSVKFIEGRNKDKGGIDRGAKLSDSHKKKKEDKKLIERCN